MPFPINYRNSMLRDAFNKKYSFKLSLTFFSMIYQPRHFIDRILDNPIINLLIL